MSIRSARRDKSVGVALACRSMERPLDIAKLRSSHHKSHRDVAILTFNFTANLSKRLELGSLGIVGLYGMALTSGALSSL